MKIKEITCGEYAHAMKCTLSNVSKKIRINGKLPKVIRIKKFNRFYVLEVPLNFK